MQHQNLITQIKKNSSEVYRIFEKEYEGYKFIDVRIYYMDKNSGEYKPTKKNENENFYCPCVFSPF